MRTLIVVHLKNVSQVFLLSSIPCPPPLRTLFRDASGTLDKNARFSPLYRQDGNKLSNDDMLKLLADFRK